MPKAIEAPWTLIQNEMEKGTPLLKVAAIFHVNSETIRGRSKRYKWLTPDRVKKLMKSGKLTATGAVKHGPTVTGLGGSGVTGPFDGAASENSFESGSDVQVIKMDELSEDYRRKTAAKLVRIAEGAVVAPPKNWKDMDILDKMIRRTLGLDDQKQSGTVVNLQILNDRLRNSVRGDVIEGEIVTVSVQDVSKEDTEHCQLTGLESDDPLIAALQHDAEEQS